MPVLRALILLALCAGPALATLPSPANSIVPPCIQRMGHQGGVVPASGRFVVVVRDLANNPIANEPVTIDLGSAPELFLSAEQYDPVAVVDCANLRVTRTTGADGRAEFALAGWSNGSGNGITRTWNGRIFSQHLGLLGSPTVSAFNLDGASGVGANDLSVWLGDFGSAINFGRDDYDCSGGTGVNDFSLLLSAFGAGGMSHSGTACP